jgi:hypothetical protein
VNSVIEEIVELFRRITTRSAHIHVTTFTARLPARPRESCFHVKVQLTWTTGKEADVRLQSATEQTLLSAARATALSYSVLDSDEARAAINLELDRNISHQEEEDGPSAAIVTEILVLPDDRHMAETYEALLRETALTRTQQREKLERLRILSDQVLSDPALAGLWWLDNKPDKLPELVTLGKKKVFEEAVSLFGTSSEHATPDPIPELIRLFLHDLGPDLRQQLIERLHLVFISYERPDLAGQLDLYRGLARRGEA